MQREPFIEKQYLVIFPWMLILFGLYLTSLYSYLLFHSLAEIFSIVVACGIFMITWNSRRFLDNNYLLVIGIAYLFIGCLDLLHTLAYKGMAVFYGNGANLSTQLWIASRYIESLSLLCAPLFLGRKLRPRFVFTGYFLVTIVLLGSIFYWQIFPDCFVEGVGLTPFKKTSEYIISFILFVSIFLLTRNQKEFDKVVLRLLVASILLTIVAELAFTLYVSVYGIFNLIGHFCKIISFYLIYKAIIETGLLKPYDLMFRNLKQSEEAFRGSEAILRGVIDLVPHAIYANDRNGRYLLANRKAAELLGTTVENLTGSLFEDVLHNQEQLKDFLTNTRQVIDTGRPKLIPEETITDQDGNLQFLQTTKIPFGWPATGEQVALGVSVVVTDLKMAEEELRKAHDELEQRVEERTAKLNIANEQLKLEIEERKKIEGALRASEEKYRLLLENIPSIVYTGFKDWSVAFTDNKIHLLTGYHADEFNSRKIKWSDILLAEDLNDARESFVSALKADKSYSRDYRIRTKWGDILWVQDRGQIICNDEGEIEHVSGVFFDITEHKQAERALRKSEEELRLISAQLLTTQENERGRIARELHDGIGQSLSAIKFKLEDALGQVKTGIDAATAKPLELIIPLIQDTVEEVRRITMDLRPSTLDYLGILATIAWLSREFQKTYSRIHVDRKINIEENDVPESLKIVIYRVLQEALNNVAKHSGADLVRVCLDKTDGNLELSIEDNGEGFEIEQALTVDTYERGFGLGSMRERIELSGGILVIDSGKGRGTIVRASWPYDEFYRNNV